MKKLWLSLVSAAALGACATSYDDGSMTIPALRETAAVSATGDAADDPAIWVARNPEESLVIATQKQGGLYVFDLNGAITQKVPGGRPNNVDLREGFAWSDGVGPIVGASDRSDNAIVLWLFDPQSRRLEPAPRARIPTGFAEVYGFCLGRMGDDFVAIATEKEGEVGVWRLEPNPHRGVIAERIVTFNLGSISEGCVVDDANAAFYVAQELVGIWRAELSDATGANRRQIDRIGAGGNLVADVEGLTIWQDTDGGGYLIASVQGRSRFAVYNREDSAYRGAFRIGASADGSADAVSGTDGIDVVSAPLGPNYPRGMFVAQDDVNTNPSELQNFKYASWADVEAALGLR